MIKDIRCYILSLVAGTFLFATPANIASDAVLNGYASPESTAIYGIGLLALLGVGYLVGVTVGIEKHERFVEKEARRNYRCGH